jgi:adenylyl-sulfate kinase
MSEIKSKNIRKEVHKVSLEDRWKLNGHRSGVLWFTGLSGSGKTTLALSLEDRLFLKKHQVIVLDGDNIRHGLCRDLDFTSKDRAENIRRIGEVANLFSQAGFLVVTSFISPYRLDRDKVRKICGEENFHEIYVKASLDVCEKRDVKGLYKKARAGEIKDFTGISSPYELPENPSLVLDTEKNTVDELLENLETYIKEKFCYINKKIQGRFFKSTLDIY